MRRVSDGLITAYFKVKGEVVSYPFTYMLLIPAIFLIAAGALAVNTPSVTYSSSSGIVNAVASNDSALTTPSNPLGPLNSSGKLPGNQLPVDTSLSAFNRDVNAGRVSTLVVDRIDPSLFSFQLFGSSANHSVYIPAAYSKELLDKVLKSKAVLSYGTVLIAKVSNPGHRRGNFALLGFGFGLVLFAAGARFVMGRKSAFAMVRPTESSGKVLGVAGRGRSSRIPGTRFTDVAGCDEAVAELGEMVEFLKDPSVFESVGARPMRGAILIGPPGTGKTLLARAVAGEAGVPFFAVSGSDFVEKYVGVGAKRIRDLFREAKRCDKAIVFIDEIDAVARRRSADGEASGGDGERENTLIALLTELDGFTGTHVQVIAATNRADTLDPAIMRPGRLDRKIQVPAPDRLGREKILLVHSNGKPLGSDVDFTMIAKRSQGMTGADLSYLINEAAMEAVRGGLTLIDQGCFERAISTVSMGRARVSALVTEEDRAITAWHEAGHTLCAYFQEYGDKPVSVSIVPRGAAGGVTWISGSDNLFLPRNRALAQLVTALGGRAGEEVLLKGEFTQGAHNDLAKATELALAMTTQYGMTDAGLMVRSNNTLHAGGMDGANSMVEELLSSALDSARKIVVEHSELLGRLAAALLESESLELAEIESILGSGLRAQV